MSNSLEDKKALRREARRRMKDQKIKYSFDDVLRLHKVSPIDVIKEVFTRIALEDEEMMGIIYDIKQKSCEDDLALPPRITDQNIYDMLARLSPIKKK